MPWLMIKVGEGEMSLIQMTRLHAKIAELGKDNCHWHYNDCGCCVTIHGEHEAYVLDREGGETMFAGRGCECPTH